MSKAPTIPHSKPSLGSCELVRLEEVVSSGFVAPGEASRQFGLLVAERYACRFGLALNSCTSALHLALMALGVKPGDRVAVPGLVCPSVLNPIAYVGAEPVFVDVRTRDHQMDLKELKAAHARSPVAAAIIPHRYGHLMDLSELQHAGIRVIEDGAQSFGAGLQTPALQGQLAVFSFYATKMMATGCGGALVTNDEAVARFAEEASDYYRPGPSHDRVRYNYRMPDVNAAMGLSQLERLDSFVVKRRALAARYLGELGAEFPVVAPQDTAGSVWYRFVVRTRGHDHQGAILERSVREGCGIGKVEIVLDSLKGPVQPLPVSRTEWESCLSLPIYPELSDDAQQRIVACVRRAA